MLHDAHDVPKARITITIIVRTISNTARIITTIITRAISNTSPQIGEILTWSWSA